MELTENQKFWKGHLDALADFDRTTSEYAQLNGLDKRKFYDYRSRWRHIHLKREFCASKTDHADTGSTKWRDGVPTQRSALGVLSQSHKRFD